MDILVLNSGSSSVKYKLYEVTAKNDFKYKAKGLAERIGIEGSKITHTLSNEHEEVIEKDLSDHTAAIKEIFKLLTQGEHKVFNSINDITAVGHRVLHGGMDFSDSVLINDEVEACIEKNFVLGPLHNPPNLMGIRAVKELSSNMPQVAVFDTAFHQTMPPKAYMYGLPYEQYQKHKIRSYGFHGTSHRYVSKRAAEFMGKDYEELKLISCHLGNGASICAINKGKSFDTTMGLTPLPGLLMGTRTGDMDPYTPLHIMKNENLSVEEVSDLMNKKSGMLGICGHSDMREVMEGYKAGKKMETLALEMYVYRINKYIGAYMAAMQGLDGIIFTGGIGERCPIIRKWVIENFAFLGASIDEEANTAKGIIKIISSPTSKIQALVVPTDEELVIAQDTFEIIK